MTGIGETMTRKWIRPFCGACRVSRSRHLAISPSRHLRARGTRCTSLLRNGAERFDTQLMIGRRVCTWCTSRRVSDRFLPRLAQVSQRPRNIRNQLCEAHRRCCRCCCRSKNPCPTLIPGDSDDPVRSSNGKAYPRKISKPTFAVIRMIRNARLIGRSFERSLVRCRGTHAHEIR